MKIDHQQVPHICRSTSYAFIFFKEKWQSVKSVVNIRTMARHIWQNRKALLWRMNWYWKRKRVYRGKNELSIPGNQCASNQDYEKEYLRFPLMQDFVTSQLSIANVGWQWLEAQEWVEKKFGIGYGFTRFKTKINVCKYYGWRHTFQYTSRKIWQSVQRTFLILPTESQR